MEKKILLLGGNGYIGSRLYTKLLKEKFNVDNIDLCWFGKIFSETIEKDYKDLTKEEIQQYTHIILLAGHSSVSMSKENNASCISNNVNNYINLIDKITDDQILFYASTLAVYGANPKLVTEKDNLVNAKNIYDYSFIAREDISKLYPNKKLIGLRFGSVNGFSQNFRSENLINALSSNVINKKDLVISNGDAYRSVLGINDLCNAIITLINTNIIKNPIYNLSSVNNTILDFGKDIKEHGDGNLIINESIFQTDYSFNCSSRLFEEEFNFKFEDTTESIFKEIKGNFNNIVFNKKRNKKVYE